MKEKWHPVVQNPCPPTSPSQVVDDNQVNRIVAARFFSSYGTQVETVESGEKAIEALVYEQMRGLSLEDGGKHRRYHMVFMDLQMPSMDG